MPLRDGIQRFLDDMDPTILSRGADYCRSGQVERIDWDKNHVTAEVSGSEEAPYLVELDFSEEGEVEDWSCDCPYEWGPVCKHTVAVLLVIQKEPPERHKKRSRAPKIDIRPLLERAEKSQLAALILEHCQEDLRFQSRVLVELEDSGEQELAAVKALVKTSIRSNTYRGYIEMRGCDRSCADLDDALNLAHRRIKGGQYDRALDITLFILCTVVKLAGEADSSSGSLGWTIDAALETAELATAGLAKSGGGRTEWVKKLLNTVQDPVFDGWDHWRYDLLQRVAGLADEQNEGEFYAVLDRLSDRLWEECKDLPRYGYGKEDKITRYHVLRSAHGPGVAKAYLEQNLDVDEFRLILVRENMAEKDYANAERLCREKVDKEQPERWQRPSQWQYLLYEIYRGWGQREEQIRQARRLALLGEQVRLDPISVFRYGDVLAAQYREEVYRLCTAVIRKESEQVGNRREYRALCGLIKSLAGFGGRAEAKAIIAELRQRYPRRPALLDELGRV